MDDAVWRICTSVGDAANAGEENRASKAPAMPAAGQEL
jgi:hypothetical protein